MLSKTFEFFFFFCRVRSASFKISEAYKYLPGIISNTLGSENQLCAIFIFYLLRQDNTVDNTVSCVMSGPHSGFPGFSPFPIAPVDHTEHSLEGRWLHDRKERGRQGQITLKMSGRNILNRMEQRWKRKSGKSQYTWDVRTRLYTSMHLAETIKYFLVKKSWSP